MSEFMIYTDGGCRNTGNKRGQHVQKYNKSAYAFLITNSKGKKLAKHHHGFYGKTNNQMEVTGVIQALRFIRSCHANKFNYTLVSDSKYVDNMINKHWIDKWHKYNFKLPGGKSRKNAGLLKLLYSNLQQFPNLKVEWTKGHADGKTLNSRGNIFVDHYLNKSMDALPDKSPHHKATYKFAVQSWHKYHPKVKQVIHAKSHKSKHSYNFNPQRQHGMNR